VVGYLPTTSKGKASTCMLRLMQGEEPTDELKKELVHMRVGATETCGVPIGLSDVFSGQRACQKPVQARLCAAFLRKIAANEYDQLGDTSTLADRASSIDLINSRQSK